MFTRDATDTRYVTAEFSESIPDALPTGRRLSRSRYVTAARIYENLTYTPISIDERVKRLWPSWISIKTSEFRYLKIKRNYT